MQKTSSIESLAISIIFKFDTANERLNSAHILNFTLSFTTKYYFFKLSHETKLAEAIGDMRATNKQEMVAKIGSVSNAMTEIV